MSLQVKIDKQVRTRRAGIVRRMTGLDETTGWAVRR